MIVVVPPACEHRSGRFSDVNSVSFKHSSLSLHYLVGVVIIAFMAAHIYLGSCGHKVTTHYKMMITGWHEE